jgi:hypothetical protein
MKNIKTFEAFINEGIDYASTKVNGKDMISSWAGSANNERDFIKMIKDMPEELESVKVQSNTDIAYPDSEVFKGPFNSSKKAKIIKIVKDVTKMFKSQGDDIVSYQLRSFTPIYSKTHDQSPAYISYETERSKSFGRDMASGKYGSLD